MVLMGTRIDGSIFLSVLIICEFHLRTDIAESAVNKFALVFETLHFNQRHNENGDTPITLSSGYLASSFLSRDNTFKIK